MHKIPFEYTDGKIKFKALIISDPFFQGKKPLILIFHAWKGRDSVMEQKGELLAKLGYVAFLVDLYGDGIQGQSKEECAGLMMPLLEDRALLRSRVVLSYEAAKSLPGIDADKIGSIGYCFGGLCALDLARSGVDLRGAVSFHGLLGAPSDLKCSVKSKILCLHGCDDPMITLEDVLQFEKEMTRLDVDFQVHVFGQTTHAFTNPEANDPEFGTVYSERSDKRSWILMRDFFEEVFA